MKAMAKFKTKDSKQKKLATTSTGFSRLRDSGSKFKQAMSGLIID